MTLIIPSRAKLNLAINTKSLKLQAPRKALVIMSILALTGCSSIGINNFDKIQQSKAHTKEFPETNLNQIAKQVTKDVFKPGDIADVSVYNIDTLTNTYVVDRNGNINFPLIGSIHVTGQTTTQLQETLTQSYSKDYIRSPSINVKLESQNLGRIVVDGAVNKPGVFDVNEIVTLSEVIALAQGLNNNDTDGGNIYIIRNIEGERKVKEVDIREIRQLGAADPQIIPNDVIFVQNSNGRIAFQQFLKTIPLVNTALIYAFRR